MTAEVQSLPRGITTTKSIALQKRRKAFDDEILRLRGKILEIEHSILTLYTRRNAATEICLLPPEVLSTIFAFLRGDGQQFAWIKVTHVCRIWRNTALADPSLWSYITPARPERTVEFLARSQAAPLSLCVHLDRPSESFNVITLALQETPRIRDLSISFSLLWPDKEREKLLALLSHCAPALECFSFKLETLFRSSHVIDLPPNLFQDAAPRLRALELVNCHLPGVPLFAKQLTRLHISYNSAPPQHRFTVQELHTLLKSVLMLEDLLLEHVNPAVSEDARPEEHPKPILLISLKKIRVVDSGANVTRVMSLLRPGRTVTQGLNVQVECQMDSERDTCHAIIEVLVDLLGPESVHSLRIAHIVSNARILSSPMDTFLVKGWPMAQLDVGEANLMLAFRSAPTDHEFIAELAHTVCRKFPLTSLETLHVECLMKLSDQQWFEALSELGNLTMLWAFESPAVRLVAALAAAGRRVASGELPPASVLLPRLRTLAIDLISMRSVYPCSTTGEYFVYDLRQLLVERQNQGARVEELRLQHCRNFTEDDVESLREVVGAVDMNEKTTSWFALQLQHNTGGEAIDI